MDGIGGEPVLVPPKRTVVADVDFHTLDGGKAPHDFKAVAQMSAKAAKSFKFAASIGKSGMGAYLYPLYIFYQS